MGGVEIFHDILRDGEDGDGLWPLPVDGFRGRPDGGGGKGLELHDMYRRGGRRRRGLTRSPNRAVGAIST